MLSQSQRIIYSVSAIKSLKTKSKPIYTAWWVVLSIAGTSARKNSK